MRSLYLPYLACAAAVATVFPGGTVLITQTGDMIEIGSAIWLDSRQLDLTTRWEACWTMYEWEVAEVSAASPTEEPPEPTLDWYQPFSTPIFKRDRTALLSSVFQSV